MTDKTVDLLCNATGFPSLRAKKGRAVYAAIVELAFKHHREHRACDDPESIPIPALFFDELSPAFRKHLKLNVLECTNKHYDPDKNISCAWKLHSEYRQRIVNAMKQPRPGKAEIINVGTGRRTTRVGRFAETGKPLDNVSEHVAINLQAISTGIEALPQWIEYFGSGCKSTMPTIYRKQMQGIIERKRVNDENLLHGVMREYCERAQLELIEILNTAGAKNGLITQRYKQITTGRFYISGLSLMGVTTLARNTALNGCYLYDFSSCHPTIALQLSEQWSDCPELKYLRMSVENKDGIRELIAHQTGQSTGAAKTSLILPFYGADIDSRWKKGAFVSALTHMGHQRIRNSDFFKLYEQDIELFFYHLLNKCPRTEKNQAINCLKLIADEFATKKSEAAHLMQAYESQAMQAAIKVTGSALLWLHDGFISRRAESIDKMQNAVTNKTGFHLEIVGVRLECDGLPLM